MVRAQSPVIRFRRKVQWKPEYWWYSPFVAQWLALMVFSTIQYNRFALTHDFALYWQAVWLIAHGHLDPYASMDLFPFLDNHFELIMWIVAPLYWIWPHASLLLYIQDIALIGAEWIAWHWIKSLIALHAIAEPGIFLGVCAALLVLNPWIPWTAATDFHSESLAALTLTGASYALYRSNRTALVIWVLLSLACGDVSAVALAAVGVAGVLTKRWKPGILIILVSLGWLELISALGANRGSILILIYGYLLPAHYIGTQMSTSLLVKSLLRRPGLALRELWRHRKNLYANISPSGAIGVFSPWVLPIFGATVIISNLSTGYLFGVPGFQNVMFYALAVVGTVQVLLYFWPKVHRRWIQRGILAIIGLNSLIWAIIWLPQIPDHWVRVSQGAAQSLQQVKEMIPASSEVIAPQGLMGRFANRQWILNMGGHNVYQYPTYTSPVYLVMAPYDGVHFSSLQTQASWLNALAHDRQAQLVYWDHNVYLWKVWAHGRSIRLPSKQTHLPAWPFNPTGGYQVVGGLPRTWYLASKNSAAGNILDRDYWREPPGDYIASVTLSGWGPASVQVWDATTGHLISEQWVPLASGRKITHTQTYFFSHSGPPHVFSGIGPWSIVPARGLYNELEIRVYAQPSSMVNVYSVGMQKKG